MQLFLRSCPKAGMTPQLCYEPQGTFSRKGITVYTDKPMQCCLQGYCQNDYHETEIVST